MTEGGAATALQAFSSGFLNQNWDIYFRNALVRGQPGPVQETSGAALAASRASERNRPRQLSASTCRNACSCEKHRGACDVNYKMEGSIAVLPAKQLQGIAVQAARSGVPLTAMRLLKALAVRCARDADALMHVCTALHVQNDFFILYGRLHCCYDIDEFFELFACVQRAYGTRVFSNVTYCGVTNCVCVVTLYRVCVFRVVARDVSVVRTFVTREVNVRGDQSLMDDIRDYVALMQALPLPPGAEAAELLLPALTLQDLPLNTAIMDRAGALQELREVLSPLHPPPQ